MISVLSARFQDGRKELHTACEAVFREVRQRDAEEQGPSAPWSLPGDFRTGSTCDFQKLHSDMWAAKPLQGKVPVALYHQLLPCSWLQCKTSVMISVLKAHFQDGRNKLPML